MMIHSGIEGGISRTNRVMKSDTKICRTDEMKE